MNLKIIKNNSLVQNVIILATGTASAQAIGMAFAPIVTRLYGPEAFGQLGTFMALVGVITPVAGLTYPIAIVLPKEDSHARGIGKLSICSSLILSIFLALIFVFNDKYIIDLFGIQSIRQYILLIPILIIFSTFLQVYQQWLIRKKRFNIIARVVIILTLIINCAKTGVGLFKPIPSVLILLSTISIGLHAAILGYFARLSKSGESQQKKEELKTSLLDLAKTYYDFPLYRAPQVFINAVSRNLPVIMLASFFGLTSAGFYTLSRTVVGMPSRLIGKSVGDVFYPRITQAAHDGEDLTYLIFKATFILAVIGFVPFSLIVLFGPWIFSFIFGNEWVTAGEYARWLSIWLFFALMNRPSIAAIATLSLQGFFLKYEIVSVLLRISALLTGCYLLSNEYAAIILFCFSGVFLNLFLIAFTLYKSKENKRVMF